MYFIASCTESLKPVMTLVGYLVHALWIGIPIVLIIFGMIDLGKAVIASKEDEVKKATKAFGKRFLYAVGVFAVVWLVTTVFSLVANLGIKDVDEAAVSSWQGCWACIKNNGKESDTCNYVPLTGNSTTNNNSGNDSTVSPGGKPGGTVSEKY